MTDLQLKPISVKKVIITLLATGILGFVAAYAAWGLLLSTSQAIAIVSIGRQDQATFIEEPQAVIERIRSPGFAAAASTRAGISELSTLLPAGQYGGTGALTARNLRDLNLIEIRINLPQPELALKAITAVVAELIANHDAKTAPRIQNLQSTLATLDRHASELIKSSDIITKNLNSNGEISQDNTGLLSARALTESGLVAVIRSENDIRLHLASFRGSQAITVPTVTTPKASSLYRAVAAGSFAGLLAGLLCLQMFPHFFRTRRTCAEISRPESV